MAAETSPAFQFYVKEWRSSRAIMRMTFAQRGMYLEMLLEQWENLTVPDSPEACAELIGGSAHEWRRAWPVLRRKFVAVESGLVNVRLENERTKQKNRSRRAADRGAAGARVRWEKSKTGEKTTISDSTSIAQPSPQDASSMTADSFAFAIPIATAEREKNTASLSPAAPAKATPTPEPDPFVDAAITERAGRFIERYEALYPKHLKGARYLVQPRRDYQKAVELCATWTDDARLDKLATIFLTTDHKFAAEGSRTIPQFAALASWCDARLAEWEQRQGVA